MHSLRTRVDPSGTQGPWSDSSIYLDFERTEKQVWVSDWYCFDGECEDWGGYETKYVRPFILTSKYAYWF